MTFKVIRGQGQGQEMSVCTCVCVVVAVDEQNNQTLTFEAENACLPANDNIDDDYNPIMSPGRDHLMVSPGRGLLLTPAVSPVHIPSSSSGYGSSTQGGFLTPDELPTHHAAVSLPPGDDPILPHGPDISTEIPSESGGPLPGNSAEPSDNPGESADISSTSSGISTHPSIILTQPADAAKKSGDIPAVRGCSGLSQLDGISSQSGGILPCPVSDVPTVEVASIPPSTINIPTITTDLLLDADNATPSQPICTRRGLLPLTTGQPMASLAVPRLSLSLDTASSDGDSSFCSTPGNSTPEVLSPGIFTPEGCQSPLFIPSGMMYVCLCLLSVCLFNCL